MKTLLIFHSNRSAVRDMCEASAMEGVDVLELRPRYKKRPLFDTVVDSYRALAGRGVRLAPLDIDFDKYDSIVLVDSLRMLSPSAECNEFLYRCDLGGRDVTCVVSNRVRRFGRAGSQLRKRIRLAGGACRGITFLSEADLRDEEAADAFALQKQI
ncbi:MAG: hypothetical protein LBB75_02420 [Oscillospiraceae bacterium]|jgi:hypothetical protein|nr:hypothetical protein [Oscillospiraceae bacterium]